ncbi:hypothetical protein JH06_0794 [Blastocystis sp. subtype 4]|uniref:hypothetical protein n=1 Tax=Blastocystis sp. subtype 4 TaxID=944170 RepID=UPI000711956B|nr:hypothetical protein JH06_0794 [Blastocystis sp. subtype 4]KNB46467.1 hypothetical protein JH06_0794 [Blastocystis sp. subtype 4]|eukprot:XP_014529897.1 hypothetical protein JH06_0794 [Blastocystis sp. subtype 4]
MKANHIIFIKQMSEYMGAFLAQQPGFEQEVVTRTVYEENGPERLLPYAFQSYLSVC